MGKAWELLPEIGKSLPAKNHIIKGVLTGLDHFTMLSIATTEITNLISHLSHLKYFSYTDQIGFS